MGTTYLFICNKCNYEVESSGQLDYGMMAVVEPYICNQCNEITDVLVGEMGEKYDKNNLPNDRFDYYECSKCKSKDITPWDVEKKPCPKCEGTLEKGQMAMLWD